MSKDFHHFSFCLARSAFSVSRCSVDDRIQPVEHRLEELPFGMVIRISASKKKKKTIGVITAMDKVTRHVWRET
ncbi:MAG: hypothetical protein R3C97_19355 [Geminicoccaceae bacterium]